MKKFVFVTMFAIVMMTGFGFAGTSSVAYAASDAPAAATEDDKGIIDRAKEGAAWWTRSTKRESWVNPETGTKVTIKERRKEGDFEVRLDYTVETLNRDETRGWKYTAPATTTMYVEELTDGLINELRSQ